ncbi:MAG: hydroxyacid dehydrogenase [Deltaproteobacteria bacterium]|nr:hydroxyacid dehydrogenase [Deltaproteobacteria bacterium]
MKPLIGIVNSSSFGRLFPDHLQRIGAFAKVERVNIPASTEIPTLIRELSDFHGIIVSVTPRFTSEVLQELTKLVVICRHGIGFDNIDIKTATRLGICVSRVPGVVEQQAVAEHTLLLMLAACRQLVQAREAVIKGNWGNRAQFIGIELRDQKIGLIGLGNVGRRVAEMLKNGFGGEVVAFDPFLTDTHFQHAGVKRVSYEELLTSCSVISLHCSLNETSYHCIGEKEFSMMQKGVILVNTSRGELIDEKALEDALKRGFVGAYASDVTENMPAASDHPLLKYPNVVVLPHLGSYTLQSLKGMGDTMVQDLENVFVHNSFPHNLVDREVMQTGLRSWS